MQLSGLTWAGQGGDWKKGRLWRERLQVVGRGERYCDSLWTFTFGSSGWSAILSLGEALSLPWAEALDMACRRLQYSFTRVHHADSLGISFPQGFLHSHTTHFSFIQLTELLGHLADKHCGTALSCGVVKCYTVVPKSFEWMVTAKVGTVDMSHSWNITVGTCPTCETDLFQSVNQSARSLAYCSAAGLGTSVSVSSFTSFATLVSKWFLKKCCQLQRGREWLCREEMLISAPYTHDGTFSESQCPMCHPGSKPWRWRVSPCPLQFFHIKQAVKMLDGKETELGVPVWGAQIELI